MLLPGVERHPLSPLFLFMLASWGRIRSEFYNSNVQLILTPTSVKGVTMESINLFYAVKAIIFPTKETANCTFVKVLSILGQESFFVPSKKECDPNIFVAKLWSYFSLLFRHTLKVKFHGHFSTWQP